MQDTVPTLYTRLATGDTKFDLMLRTRELKQFESLLKQIYTYSPGERKAWVNSNGEFYSLAFEQFVTDTNRSLQNVAFDDETLTLSRDLVMALRETGELLEGLVAKGRRLRS